MYRRLTWVNAPDGVELFIEKLRLSIVMRLAVPTVFSAVS